MHKINFIGSFCKEENQRKLYSRLNYKLFLLGPPYLLASTGALVVMMVYYISVAAAAATFSDFHSVH